MDWHRVTVADKIAWREDMATDTTLTDRQKAMLSVIATNWDNATMLSECSLSFIAAGAGTTKKLVHRYVPALLASGRVGVAGKPTYTDARQWTVNWWYRGGAWYRHKNGGPVFDCRESPMSAQAESPDRESPSAASPPVLAVPQPGDQFPLTGNIGAPRGSAPYTPLTGLGHAGAPEEKKEKVGFAKWRVVHAGYEGDDDNIFVAHLRSGKKRKFTLRVSVDSDDYDSLDKALLIDGEPDRLAGKLVLMSTNREGPKTFMRDAPMPWTPAEILSGSDTDDGAVMRVAFLDRHRGEANMKISDRDADALAELCGGREEIVGARIRYRLMPDDSMDFEKIRDVA